MKITTTSDKYNLECTQQELEQLLDLVRIAMSTKYLHQSVQQPAAEIESLLSSRIEKRRGPAEEGSLPFIRKDIDQKEHELLLDNGYKIRYEEPSIYLDKISNRYTIDQPLLDTE